jgi:hypothetical protein
VAPQVPAIGHGHVHELDPNAAWFAAASIVVKEWLYRVTKKVADDEKSPVLLANAVHHRSDAYSSIVAFLAITGSRYFPAIPLDPIGGAASASMFCAYRHLMRSAAVRSDRFAGYPASGSVDICRSMGSTHRRRGFAKNPGCFEPNTRSSPSPHDSAFSLTGKRSSGSRRNP